jgi:6,7-dimethyl-8-ribityllumazine synthase
VAKNQLSKEGSVAAVVAPDIFSECSVGVVVSQYNSAITFNLRDAAIETLTRAGIHRPLIHLVYVPGAWELPLAVQLLFKQKSLHAALALGCVIKGETSHDEHINRSVSNALMDISLRFNKPVGFGLLTVNSVDQAEARAGGSVGNKGEETANAVLALLQFAKSL